MGGLISSKSPAPPVATPAPPTATPDNTTAATAAAAQAGNGRADTISAGAGRQGNISAGDSGGAVLSDTPDPYSVRKKLLGY